MICWLRGSRTVLEDGVRMPMRMRFDMLMLLLWNRNGLIERM